MLSHSEKVRVLVRFAGNSAAAAYRTPLAIDGIELIGS
jgi:hypothetical protein